MIEKANAPSGELRAARLGAGGAISQPHTTPTAASSQILATIYGQLIAWHRDRLGLPVAAHAGNRDDGRE